MSGDCSKLFILVTILIDCSGLVGLGHRRHKFQREIPAVIACERDDWYQKGLNKNICATY